MTPSVLPLKSNAGETRYTLSAPALLEPSIVAAFEPSAVTMSKTSSPETDAVCQPGITSSKSSRSISPATSVVAVTSTVDE